jgi:hypothetical protein
LARYHDSSWCGEKHFDWWVQIKGVGPFKSMANCFQANSGEESSRVTRNLELDAHGKFHGHPEVPIDWQALRQGELNNGSTPGWARPGCTWLKEGGIPSIISHPIWTIPARFGQSPDWRDLLFVLFVFLFALPVPPRRNRWSESVTHLTHKLPPQVLNPTLILTIPYSIGCSLTTLVRRRMYGGW